MKLNFVQWQVSTKDWRIEKNCQKWSNINETYSTSLVRSDLASQFEIGSGACQLSIAKHEYSSPFHRTYNRTPSFCTVYICYQPAFLRASRLNNILTAFHLFSPHHNRLYSAPFAVYIYHTLPVPVPPTSTPYHSFTAGYSSALALSYPQHLLLRRYPAITHHLTAKYAKKRSDKFRPWLQYSVRTHKRTPCILRACWQRAFTAPLPSFGTAVRLAFDSSAISFLEN